MTQADRSLRNCSTELEILTSSYLKFDVREARHSEDKGGRHSGSSGLESVIVIPRNGIGNDLTQLGDLIQLGLHSCNDKTEKRWIGGARKTVLHMATHCH